MYVLHNYIEWLGSCIIDMTSQSLAYLTINSQKLEPCLQIQPLILHVCMDTIIDFISIFMHMKINDKWSYIGNAYKRTSLNCWNPGSRLMLKIIINCMNFNILQLHDPLITRFTISHNHNWRLLIYWYTHATTSN